MAHRVVRPTMQHGGESVGGWGLFRLVMAYVGWSLYRRSAARNGTLPDQSTVFGVSVRPTQSIYWTTFFQPSTHSHSCCWSCEGSTIESKWESTITHDSLKERWSSILCVCFSFVDCSLYPVGLILYNPKPSPTVLYIHLLYVIHHLQTWDVSPHHMKGLVTQNVVSNRNIIWTRLLLG